MSSASQLNGRRIALQVMQCPGTQAGMGLVAWKKVPSELLVSVCEGEELSRSRSKAGWSLAEEAGDPQGSAERRVWRPGLGHPRQDAQHQQSWWPTGHLNFPVP